MAEKQIWTPFGTVGTGTPVDLVERGSDGTVTTTTADPSTGGTSLAVTDRSFGGEVAATGGFKVRVMGSSGIPELMLVTAGGGSAGAGNLTVTRGQDGTTGVAHAIGAVVQLVTAVQRVEPVDGRQVSFQGRAGTFRTPGRAGTAGQKLMAIHNATGSPTLVELQKITVDLWQTVVKAVTVAPPIIRIHRFTAVPTNGSTLPKVAVDSAQTSRSAVTLWQDASADGTASGTTLTVTIPASSLVTQEPAPRLITAAGYEMFDRTDFLQGESEYMTLRPLEGIVLNLDYTLATQNPVTDMWVANMRWIEYLPAS
jgi:hypothetical protein